jgi:hypothetical protein
LITRRITDDFPWSLRDHHHFAHRLLKTPTKAHRKMQLREEKDLLGLTADSQ